MNEQQPPSSGFSPDAGSASHGAGAYELTPGAFLREAREAAGVHLVTLAASLKVSVKKLEALEQDQFDLLPDAVFARALASSVCRMLKLDPAPVLDRLPPVHTARFVSQDRGINEPFRPRNIGPAPSVWSQVSRPAVLAGLVLLLGALVLIFLPSIRRDSTPDNTGTAAPAVGPQSLQSLPALLPRASAVPEDIAMPAAGPGPSAEPAVSGGGQAVVSGVASVSSPLGAAPLKTAAALIAVTATASSVVPADPSSIATFRATGESWIKVTDAKGLVVLNRTMGAGEVVGVSGVLPLAAVVGRADATQVRVRGQAFDLGAVTKNNVARFEVK